MIKYLNERSQELEIDVKKEWFLFKLNRLTAPLRTNGYDCGVFMIMYALFLLEEVPFAYKEIKIHNLENINIKK